MPVKDALIELSQVSYRPRGIAVLESVDLKIGTNEIISLIGPNGAGKTTLVRILLGVLKPDQGMIRRKENLKIAYVPQRMEINPLLPLSVKRFLLLNDEGVSQSLILQALEELGVGHLLHRPLSVLSGGEWQRVMMGRAIARKPNLLILDEPVQGMDVTAETLFYNWMAKMRKALECSIFMVSHDLHMVMSATDRVICLNRHICCAGVPEEVGKHQAFLELYRREPLTLYHHHHDHTH